MTKFAARVIDANLEKELGDAFGRYAQATILDRAIPDVRDGLKPVQRRIIYAMYRAGNRPDRRYRKCAKTVGDVMGNFHPHGDQSIYDAMVRLAQSWKLRHMLVDGHGNFGSIDDDPPAAMRYTEARMAQISMELVRDIEKDTVRYQPNFDDSDSEPTVLPSRYPNLLVNGTSGVSTGFATEIQPHNLGEVIDAIIALIDEPTLDLDGILKHIQGPDFPTGGIVMGLDGLREAYETGKGRVVLRARTSVEPTRDKRVSIVITEIPYGVIKSNLVREIEKLRTNKVVQGIKDVRDETDREGLRIVVDLGRGIEAEPVLAYLFKKTDLQVYRHFQMVSIVNRSPMLLGIKPILEAYIEHQKDVVTRRSKFDLARAQKRLHLVEGLIKAVDVLDEVIATIRGSKDRPQAHERLMAKFDFSEEQTKEILDLRLHRLTGLQIKQLLDEEKALKKEIAALEKLLKSTKVLMRTIQKELLQVKEAHADPRRSSVVAEIDKIDTKIRETVTVKEQSVIIGITREGYIKRSVHASFEKTEGDAEFAGTKEGDYQRWIIRTNTLHRILLFTARGQCFTVPVHQIPETRWGDMGTALVNIVGLEKDDSIVHAMSIEAFEKDEYVLFVTSSGVVKRTPTVAFDSSRSSGLLGIKLNDNDEITRVLQCGNSGTLMLVTVTGMAIRFPIAEISPQGRSARGVRGMKLKPNELITDAICLPEESEADAAAPTDTGEVAIITREGRAKRTATMEYPVQRRGGRGVRCVTHRQRLPHKISSVLWWPKEQANRGDIRIVLDNTTAQTQSVTKMRFAARDGNGYEFAEDVPQRVYLASVEFIAAEPLENPTDETAQTEGADGEPVDDGKSVDSDTVQVAETTEEATPAPMPTPATPIRPVEANRGNWLPGMGPDPQDEE